jgi:phage FluMu protein Com
MASNPLQQFFRQPKLYISLPSMGAYNKPTDFEGEISNLPVYGMTGMDEVIVKTPDALLSGESTVKVIKSCVPGIKDPWNLTTLDLDTVLTAVRAATHGNRLDIENVCPKCNTHNDYDFDLSTFIEYYASCKFENKVVAGDLIINLRPLTYKQSSEYAIKNFQLQQMLKQVNDMTDENERRNKLAEIYESLAVLQNDIFFTGIDSVDTGSTKVTERGFIKEWVENCDGAILDLIREQITANQQKWRSPTQKVKCENCGHEQVLSITLDQSDFFVPA